MINGISHTCYFNIKKEKIIFITPINRNNHYLINLILFYFLIQSIYFLTKKSTNLNISIKTRTDLETDFLNYSDFCIEYFELHHEYFKNNYKENFKLELICKNYIKLDDFLCHSGIEYKEININNIIKYNIYVLIK